MGGVKKSAYIFLCSILGVLLFLVLDRIVVFWYIILAAYGVFGNVGFSSVQFVATDYIIMLLAMLCGSWYGIWIGSYWYELVYERGSWRNAFFQAKEHLMPRKKKDADIKHKVEAVTRQLEQSLAQAEKLVERIPQQILKPAPIKRTITRKKPVKRKTKKI
jgi:hypothetical protein